jgi:hypothetical protein
MGNAATASRGTPAGILTVQSAGEQTSLLSDGPTSWAGQSMRLVVNDGRVSRRHSDA